MAKTAQTMDELLQKTGYQPRGLSRGQKVEGTVVNKTSKSLILDIGAKAEGVVAEREFEAAREFIKKLKKGDCVQATVLVPEAESGQSILSIREQALFSAWEALAEAKKKDKAVEFQVDSVTRGGLTVTAEGIQGFIPGSHLGGELGKLVSKNPQKIAGQTVRAKIIELDPEQNRLVLSEKAVSEAELLKEQEKALKKVKKGEKYRGKVVGLTGFGAFVQIEVDGVPIDGLVHLSELSWEKVDNPEEIVNEGDEVEVVVIGKASGPDGSGPGGGRLALSIKQIQDDPWKSASKKYKPDTQVKGKVTKVGDFGALIALEPGVEGLLHMSKIPAGVSLNKADVVSCFVEEVDEKARRISLGMVLKEKPIGYK